MFTTAHATEGVSVTILVCAAAGQEVAAVSNAQESALASLTLSDPSEARAQPERLGRMEFARLCDSLVTIGCETLIRHGESPTLLTANAFEAHRRRPRLQSALASGGARGYTAWH